MSCPSTGSLNSTIWTNNCIITTNTTHHNLLAFKTCCETYNGLNSVVQTYPNPPCYEYCQGQASNVSACFNKLVPSINPPLTHSAVDLHCYLDRDSPKLESSTTRTLPVATASGSLSPSTLSIPIPTLTKTDQGTVGNFMSIEALTLVGLAVLGVVARLVV